MYAKADNAGKILRRSQVCSMGGRGLPKGEYPCICIQTHGRWKWQRLDKLSQKKFHEHREAVSQQIFSAKDDEQLPLLPLEIRNAHGENIVVQGQRKLNGRWLPQDQEKHVEKGEYQIYKHEKSDDLWLYQVSNGDWWIGTRINMKRRKPWGFARPSQSRDRRAAFSGHPPWEVPLWKVWSRAPGENEKWHESGMNIAALSNKHCAQKEMDERIKKMEFDFARDLNAAMHKCEMYSKVMHLLFNDLTREKRLEMISSSVFGDLFKVEQLCSGCLCSEQIIKCVHFDCPGACQACRDLHDKDALCGACGKDQHMDCPICMEKYLPDFMNILSCKHAVCWKCTCRAYETKKPLEKCPICRASINKKAAGAAMDQIFVHGLG